jgi:hypothetical protein
MANVFERRTRYLQHGRRRSSGEVYQLINGVPEPISRVNTEKATWCLPAAVGHSRNIFRERGDEALQIVPTRR